MAVRARFALFAGWTAFWALRFYSPSPWSGDWLVFEGATRLLARIDGGSYTRLPGGPLALYADLPKVQIGPPALLLALPSQFLAPPIGRATMAAVMAAVGLLVMFLAERLGARSGRNASAVKQTSLYGGLLLLPVWCTLGVAYMHLDDVLVIVLLELALLAGLSRRPLPMAILLGCAVATKPWAICFLPLVGVLPRSEVRRAATTAFLVAAAWWLPFLVGAPGTTAALNDTGTVTQPMSIWALAGVHVQPTAGRELQFALAFAAAAIMVARHQWSAAPVVATAVRLAVDWQTWSYYGATLVVCALLYDVCESRRNTWPWVTTCALAAAVVVPVVNATSISPVAAGCVRLGLLAATAALVIGRGRRPTPELTAAEAPEALLLAVP